MPVPPGEMLPSPRQLDNVFRGDVVAKVRRFRKRFWDDPSLLLELDLIDIVGSASDAECRCSMVRCRPRMDRSSEACP